MNVMDTFNYKAFKPEETQPERVPVNTPSVFSTVSMVTRLSGGCRRWGHLLWSSKDVSCGHLSTQKKEKIMHGFKVFYGCLFGID